MVADAKRGYWSTNAPLVIRNHVLVGVSGDFDNLPGILQSFDPEMGAHQWTFYSTPPVGTPGSQSGGATGGQMWMTGTYDPDLNLVFVGTGNPTPVLNGPMRPGNNPWTGSIVALDPDTGKLAWGFQASPHDTHDWDAAEVPVLVDADFNGAPRKLLLQASRNGYFFVLDRTTGKNLLTKPFATVNWAKGIDSEGRPIPDPAKEPSRDGVLIAPNASGGTNYRSPRFDPRSGLLVVSAHAYGSISSPEHGSWMGGRRLRRVREGHAARDVTRPVVKWSTTSVARQRRRADDRHRSHVFGDAANSVFALQYQRWRDTLALDDRPCRQRSDHAELDGRQHGGGWRRCALRVDAAGESDDGPAR